MKTIKLSLVDRTFNWIVYGTVSVFMMICLYPLILMISSSFSTEKEIIKLGYSVWPRGFTLDTYSYLFQSGGEWIMSSYLVSIFVTVAGTIGSMLITAMLAYALSSKKLKYRNSISMYCYFTMLFNGGLVPWYILIVNYYQLTNTLAALIVPYLLNVFFLFVMRSYFDTIPEPLLESARIDGATEIYIFARIMIPIALPGIATISLFYAIQYWNDWWLSLLFIRDDSLYPLQYRLYNLLSNTQALASNMSESAADKIAVPTVTVKAAITMITIAPILLVFPFIQRFFVKGLMIGAVKG
ncbi:carbohydrate ABC transporter permease [Paenibacillus sp. PAMC21692]|uniref:carbohydrate ABC transporter permease n=1 Tax=Paenibacillus sp. PAMC21692 TaxID=2762320 RepID=UPI0021C46D76|nr:carbohydrate ABC transporter permease [Paenibacillus sp. PAMC21692]